MRVAAAIDWLHSDRWPVQARIVDDLANVNRHAVERHAGPAIAVAILLYLLRPLICQTCELRIFQEQAAIFVLELINATEKGQRISMHILLAALFGTLLSAAVFHWSTHPASAADLRLVILRDCISDVLQAAPDEAEYINSIIMLASRELEHLAHYITLPSCVFGKP